MTYNFSPIAYVRSDYPEKFGVPRQAGLVTGAPARIVFEKEYRRPEAFRELDGFSHIWLIWVFSESPCLKATASVWQATVRPPRLGGNRRVGVFASRSPNRPNPIGLSVVSLLKVDLEDPEGPVLVVDGVDMIDGTPILDVKPYIPYSDSIPAADGGFASGRQDYLIEVEIPEEELGKVPEDRREALKMLLAQRPVPAYQHDPEKEYGISFAGCNIRFTLDEKRLKVFAVERF